MLPPTVLVSCWHVGCRSSWRWMMSMLATRRPFRALLDVGLVRTTTRKYVFGALKGALDGGLDIPHIDKRFAGFCKDDKSMNPEVHQKYIFGSHMFTYMKMLREDEPSKYQSQFSKYLEKGIEPEGVEEMYKKVHAAIKAYPSVKHTEKHVPKEQKDCNLRKLTYEERKANLISPLNALNAGDEDDEE